MRLEHHLHVVGGYVRYISPHIIIIIIIWHYITGMQLLRGSEDFHIKKNPAVQKIIRDDTGIRLVTLLIDCWFLRNLAWVSLALALALALGHTLKEDSGSAVTCIKQINMQDTDTCALYSIQTGRQIVDMKYLRTIPNLAESLRKYEPHSELRFYRK